MTFTTPATAVTSLLRAAARRGLPTAGPLADAQLDEATLADPDHRVPQPLFHALWASIATASGDPDFGLHVAEDADPDAFHVVAHAAMRQRTLGDALAVVARFSRLMHDAGRVELEPRGDALVVFPGCRGLRHDWPRHIAESSAASLVVLGRVVTGRAWSPRAVHFRHSRPASIAEHERLFGAPITFGAAETEVVLAGDLLELPLATQEPVVGGFLESLAAERLARLPVADALPSGLREAITDSFASGEPEVAPLARRLGVSTRTLQRRLAAAGTSFRAVVDDVRRARALELLRDESLATGEAAFLLGFAELSSFYRAFRRWTGGTPVEWRRGQLRR